MSCSRRSPKPPACARIFPTASPTPSRPPTWIRGRSTRSTARLEEARRLPPAEVTALLRVGELDGETAAAIREAVQGGRLFAAGLRDLVGRYALRGADLGAFVLRDVL